MGIALCMKHLWRYLQGFRGLIHSSKQPFKNGMHRHLCKADKRTGVKSAKGWKSSVLWAQGERELAKLRNEGPVLIIQVNIGKDQHVQRPRSKIYLF